MARQGEGDDTSLLRRLESLLPIEGALRPQFEPAYSIADRLRTIHRAPLRNLRHSIWWIRKTFFTRPRSETPAYLVSLSKPEIVRLFGRHHFEPGWELSYNYFGEVLNIRRVEYRDETPYDWWQIHIRGYFHEDGGIELSAHYETEPTEHPDAHIALYGLDVERGMETVQDILDDAGVEYTYLTPDEATGVADTEPTSVDAAEGPG